MLDSDDATLWYSLNRLIADYWAEVDDNGGSLAHEFYLPDAVYSVGTNRFEGAEKIRAFYARRGRHGTITTRHLISNVRVFRDGARSAQAGGVMSLYRADGPPPIERMRPPAMIADFAATCLLGDDETWRFKSHVIRPIFVGSDRPASISIDSDRL
ncbi:MAG: nuclear transport factor 2 family protein [Alphaproteobacteria bacterium]|nr:nuclear transport factor 2 family protein [Alphaproteobacteria bacterium]MBV9198857.1 nuclear transport factor 2 family protein [Alphaproteobacteria bacterium]MBV9375330.1 nuclear transport factor 2 family protein [Alphaproteobacteria bacterium]